MINLMEDGEDLAGDFGGSNDVMTAEENDSMQGKQEWSRRYILYVIWI